MSGGRTRSASSFESHALLTREISLISSQRGLENAGLSINPFLLSHFRPRAHAERPERENGALARRIGNHGGTRRSTMVERRHR